ncbi:MAG: hypothetical protein Kow0020_10430 [Wenzhouxiangellaceae bacterium]
MKWGHVFRAGVLLADAGRHGRFDAYLMWHLPAYRAVQWLSISGRGEQLAPGTVQSFAASRPHWPGHQAGVQAPCRPGAGVAGGNLLQSEGSASADRAHTGSDQSGPERGSRSGTTSAQP